MSSLPVAISAVGSVAVSKVKGIIFPALYQMAQSKQMSVRQIGDMNVIPNACSVRRGIIGSKYFNVIALACCHIQYQGDKMGLGIVGSPISPAGSAPPALKYLNDTYLSP